jgi:hypothetical protein
MRITNYIGIGLVLALASVAATAQVHRHSTGSPYAGMEARTVKALSAEQIADLQAGRGMGLALTAELNGYPGPLHVIEHAAALQLTSDQERRTRTLFAEMKAETIPLGQRLIAEETRLDRAFADRTITPDTLKEATAAIGATQAMLRAAHLRFHLAQVEVLTRDQTRQYNELRGYLRRH